MKTMPVAVEERVFLVKSISAEVIFTIPKQKGVHINSHLFLVTKKNSLLLNALSVILVNGHHDMTVSCYSPQIASNNANL